MIPNPIHIPLEEPLDEGLLGQIEEAVGDQELEERIVPVEERIQQPVDMVRWPELLLQTITTHRIPNGDAMGQRQRRCRLR